MPLIPLVLRNSLRHEVDGGWAWVVVAASFMIQTILFGIIQSYGTMFVALLDDFKSGEYETAWIGSMGYGLTFFIGPIYAALSEHFGCRKMVYCGTLICMVSCFSSSFAPNLSTLYFTFGILWGIGAGMTFFPCLLVLNFYFSNRISLANGITMAGSAIGTLIFNASLNRILELYGWRVGFRLFGGVCALMFVCGTAYLPPPQDFYAIQEWEQYQKVKLTTKLARIFDIRPWKEKAFVVWLIGVSFVLFGYFIPYVHLVRFGETLNVPLSQSTLLVGYMSISQIFAKLICGKLADMRRVKRLQILIISILSFSICNFAVTSATDFTGLLTYALFYGFFDGLFVVVLPILIRDLVGRELMANAIGNFYGVVSIPLTAGPPISGQLYDAFGSYKAPFSVAGGLMLIASFMMYFVYRLKPELLKDLPLEGEDTFTSDLIARPSIHSHTVDALSGMFLTERFSTIDSVDRPSQLTINPLHNFASVLTRSRAGSTISGRTGQRFPSFSIDMRSDGGSEIFLQRLRGYGDGASVVSSAHGKDLTGSTSTAPSDDILSSTKDSSLDRVSHGNVAFASSLNKMSTATLANESNTDVTPSSCYNEVGNLAEINHSMDKCMVRIVEPGEDSSPEKIQHEQTENITSSGMEEEEDSSKQDNLARNLEDDKIDTSLELIQISASEELNSGSTILDTNMKGLTQISEVAQIDDLSPDIDISADRTSSPIPKSFESGPTSPLITLGIDESFTEEADITLVPADNIDNETTTETIVPDDIERSTDESCGDEVLIRIPPPPTWNREVPLVDLTEDGETEELASRSSSTDVQSSTDFLCLNERLKIMAEQQKREGELRMRFPTDEMTLFATYRSNIATPSEQQSTPVFETIPQTPAPSENQSPPKTPSQVNVPLEALTLQHNGMPLHIIPCPVNENGMDTHHQLSDDILEPCAIPPSDYLISKQFAQFLPGENIEQKVQQNSSSIPEAQNSSQREPFLSIGNAHRDSSQSDSHVIEQQTVNMQVISRDSQYMSQQRTMENNIMHQQTQSSSEHHTLFTERDTAPIAAKSQFEDESTTHQFTTQLYENENIEQLQSTQTYPQVKCPATDSANINDLLLIDMTSSSTNNLGEYATNPFLQEMNNCNYSTLQHHTSADQMAKLISTDNLSNNRPHTPPSATEKHQHQRIVNDNILSQTTPEVKELKSASTDDESKDTCLQIILTPTIVDEDPRDDMIQLKDTYTTELELTSASKTTNNDLIDMTCAFPDSKPEEEWTSNQNTVRSTHLCPELEMTLGSTSFKDINDLLKITTTSDSTDNQLFEDPTLSPLLQESHPSDRTDESAQECVPASCKSDSKIKKGIIQTAVFENNAPPGECIRNVFLNTNNDCNSALPMHLSTSAVEKADDYVSTNMQSTSPNSMDTENKEDCGIRFLNDTSSSIDNYRNDTIQTNLVIASADKNNEEACIQRFNADNMQRATRFHEQQHAYVSTGGKTHDDADMKITSACDSADFNFAVERNTNPFLKETIGGDRIIQLSQTHPETKVSTCSTVSPFNSSHVLHPNVSGKEDCSTNSSQQKAFVGDSSTKPPEIKTSAEVATLVSTDNSCEDTLLQISLDHNDGKIKYEEDLTATSLQQRFDNIQQLETLCLFSENVKKCNDCTGTTYTSADSKSEEYVETNPFLEKRIDDEQSRHTTPPEATSDVQATYASNTNNDDLKRISTTCTSVSPFGRCTNLSHFDEKDNAKHLCPEILICKERCSSSDRIPNNYVIAPTDSGNGLDDKCTIPFPKQSSNNTDNPELQATCISGEITSNEKNIQKIEETPSSTETIRNPFMQDQGTNAEYLDYGVWAVKGSLDSESVVTNERKDTGGSRNPFVSEGACLQDNQEQSFLIPSRPDMIESNYKSSAISVPITLDRQVYRRKSVVIDDNSDCDKSNSNSLVNVFELELDEHDKGNTDETVRNQYREKSQKFNEETSDNME